MSGFVFDNIYYMELIFLKEVDSTNKYTKEHFTELNDFSVVYTARQTAGRGRLSRSWNFTGENNIYASILIKPRTEVKEVYANLTQFLCLILAEVFEEYGIVPKIKWPNDIRINKKKISGILAESIIEKNKVEAIILGFGVNLNCSEETIDNINQPATSLNLEINQNINKEFFLKKVLDKFYLRYNKFVEEGFISIREDYKKRAEFLDSLVKIKVFDKEISGIAKDITETGAIKLVDNKNKEHVLLIGDIL